MSSLAFAASGPMSGVSTSAELGGIDERRLRHRGREGRAGASVARGTSRGGRTMKAALAATGAAWGYVSSCMDMEDPNPGSVIARHAGTA